MAQVRRVSWGNAVIGGLLGVALVLLFVFVVAEPMQAGLSRLGGIISVGTMVLVLALLRVVAGMWTAQLVRRRYEVLHRTELLPTALAAAVIGWATYTALVLVAGAVMGTSDDVGRLFLDVLQWLFEYAIGAFLVSPQLPPARPGPDAVAGRRRR